MEGILKVFEDNKTYGLYADPNLVAEYAKFYQNTINDLPDLLTPFSRQDYQDGIGRNRQPLYSKDCLMVHIHATIGALRAELEDIPQQAVIDKKDFCFIKDDMLKKILERDYQEIQRNIISANWKSSIILSGGSIEAILLDVCLKNPDEARASAKAPKSDINIWGLNHLIEVCVDVGFVAEEIARLSHTIREYRNLIHPGREIRNSMKVEPEEAKIAVEVLNILIRDLGLETGAGKPEENDTGVGLLLLKNKLAEIAVCDYQNAPLIPGDF